MAKKKFVQIAEGRFKPTRDVVVSSAYDRDTGEHIGYIVSERLVTEDKLSPYLKSGLGIVTKEGLETLYDVIGTALDNIAK